MGSHPIIEMEGKKTRICNHKVETVLNTIVPFVHFQSLNISFIDFF